MPKTVEFGMYWEMYGRQTVDIPDDIDENDNESAGLDEDADINIIRK